ncbi:helix-turn-helix transcriptional regulator [Desertimonas flava]|uniref:helix-turn-helix transcriptional regulator n=1 Tax=Desertimonas flava TaxID=2064846 RepID=UPI000E34D492|nr:AraC family transcriptional regulator [Desertimonas flava]
MRPALFTYPPGATFGPRTLRDFEFVWVVRGRAEWQHLDLDERVTLEPGVLLLARPGMRDHLRWIADEPTIHGYVHFDLTPRPDSDGWPSVRRHAIAPSPLPALLDYLVWLAATPGATPDEVERTVATVLRIFVAGSLPDLAPPAEPEPLATALDHVRNEWSRRVRAISLGELADVAGVSAEHLTRLCKRHAGVSLATALELARLDVADELLLRTNLTVTEIARTCGYDDPLYFSRRFRHHYGHSPRAHRQRGGRTSPVDAAGLRTFADRVRPVRHPAGR